MKAKKASEIKKMDFKTYQFTGEWLDKYGNPSQGFDGLWYGASGSGKSVEVLRFGEYLSQFGKVIINSCEEGINESVKKKLIEFGIDNVYYYEDLNYQELKEVTAKRGVRFVIIDSVQQMGFTNEQYTDFMRTFGNKRSLLLISKINGKGKARGGDEMLHNVGIKVEVDAGLAKIRSRYLTDGHREVRLFGKDKVKENENRNFWKQMNAFVIHENVNYQLTVEKNANGTFTAAYKNKGALLIESDTHFDTELALSELNIILHKKHFINT